MGRHRGRHRAPGRLAVNAARIAVGGFALAEITGGLPAIPAHAEPVTAAVVPAVYSTVQPVMTRKHHKKHHAAHHAKPVPQSVVQPVQPAAQPVVQEPAAQPALFDMTDPSDSFGQQLFDHYTVQPGDTLTHIAAAYGIPYEVLFALNSDQVANGDYIYVGQRLRLPAAA